MFYSIIYSSVGLLSQEWAAQRLRRRQSGEGRGVQHLLQHGQGCGVVVVDGFVFYVELECFVLLVHFIVLAAWENGCVC